MATGGAQEEATLSMAEKLPAKEETKTIDENREKEEEKAKDGARAQLQDAKTKEAAAAEEEEETKVEMEAEPKTGVSFPVRLPDGKQLAATGVRRKKILALGINIYAFGIYADGARLKGLLRARFGEAAPKTATKEVFETAIDADVGMAVRLAIVFRGLSLSLVRKNLDESLGASVQKLNGGQKNDELVNKLLGAADDNMKLHPGSIIEMTKLPGFVLQAKVKDELVSRVESELLCRAYFQMYLGDDAFDKEAKARFGRSLLSLL